MKYLRNHYLSLSVFLVSLIYYAVLCAKTYTWVFVSGDSGDWLAASVAWMVPQPNGSPLYILLGRLLSLLPGSLPLNMTIILSCIPSAITVTIVYLTVLKKTGKLGISLVSAGVLLGATVFLTQSTVLEEYAIAVMFVTLAFYSYTREQRYTTVIFLGLGTAIHLYVLSLAFFWLIADRRWRLWLKPILLFIIVGIIPYTLIPVLMYLDTPKFIAGYLSYESLKTYFTSTTGGILGQLSIFEAPKRLLFFAKLILVTLGLGLVPICLVKYKPLTRGKAILLATVIYTSWYFITCIDETAWTFISFATPSLVILCALGLSNVRKLHMYLVIASAFVLIIVNSMYLNANILTQETPLATNYQRELKGLPVGAIVVVEPSMYSLGLFYTINQGKDLIPLVYPYIDMWSFNDYYMWLQQHYPNEIPPSLDTFGLVTYNLKQNHPVYLAVRPSSYLLPSFNVEDTPFMIKRITGIATVRPQLLKEVK